MEMTASLLLGEPCQQGLQSLWVRNRVISWLHLAPAQHSRIDQAISVHTSTKPESQKGSQSFTKDMDALRKDHPDLGNV